jgi:hypothetical protein
MLQIKKTPFIIMSTETIQLISAVIVATITSIIGPSIFEYFKQKIRNKSKSDLIKEDLERNLIIEQDLASIREELDADRVWVTQFHNGGHFLLSNKSIQKFSITHEVTKPGVSSASAIFKDIPISLYSKAINRLMEEGHIFIVDAENPQTHTYGLKNAAEATGTISSYIFALYDIGTNRCIGNLGVDYQESTTLTHEQTDILFEKAGRISGYLSVFLNIK